VDETIELWPWGRLVSFFRSGQRQVTITQSLSDFPNQSLCIVVHSCPIFRISTDRSALRLPRNTPGIPASGAPGRAESDRCCKPARELAYFSERPRQKISDNYRRWLRAHSRVPGNSAAYQRLEQPPQTDQRHSPRAAGQASRLAIILRQQTEPASTLAFSQVSLLPITT